MSVGNEVGKNIIIFGVDMSSSSHIVSKKRDILILGKGPRQGLKYTIIAKNLNSINFTKENP